MKTITIEKVVDKFNFQNPNEKLIKVRIDGELICVLRKVKNAVKEGYDSRVKFTVHNYRNELGLKFIYSGARTIKQVVENLTYDLNNI